MQGDSWEKLDFAGSIGYMDIIEKDIDVVDNESMTRLLGIVMQLNKVNRAFGSV